MIFYRTVKALPIFIAVLEHMLPSYSALFQPFQIVFRKGHSQNCEYLSCKCPQCHAIKMRNDSMAKCMSNERKSTIPKVMGFAEVSQYDMNPI